VCQVVFDYGGIPPRAEGVDLVTQPADEFRHGLPRYARSTFRALRRADADVYVQRTAGFETAIVAAFARAHRRRFAFSASSLPDVGREPPIPDRAPREVFRLGRRAADVLVVQTEEQRRRAEADLGRRTTLIRSFCQPAADELAAAEAFLWIGGLSDYKGPLAYAELAERVPEAEFWMVAAPRGAESRDIEPRLRAAAERLPNLTLLPQRGRERLLELYSRAVAVVNTSTVEGFPNTFLEGWARGVPALSLRLDPDGVIAAHGLGTVAGGSLDALADAARALWEGRGERTETAARVRGYIADNHAPERVGRQWADLLAELAAGGRLQ
jgi:glycosyltransferase involved in cell wall biosynthesis